MKFFRILACLAALAALAPMQVSAGQIRQYQVQFHNRSDMWAWITVYTYGEFNHYGILKAYCVAPHADNNRVEWASDVPHEVRIEVEHQGCSHPVVKDVKMGWDGRTPYYLTRTPDGNYRVSHTP
jgi:hypothetical protein